MRVASSADHLDIVGVLARGSPRRSSPAAPAPASCRASTDMCSGEVEMNVWMRPRLAGLIALPQRSMSAERGARQAGDDRRAWRAARSSATDPKSPVGGPGNHLDDIDAHVVEQFSDFQLRRRSWSRRGIALPSRRVSVSEDRDPVPYALVGGAPVCVPAASSSWNQKSRNAGAAKPERSAGGFSAFPSAPRPQASRRSGRLEE